MATQGPTSEGEDLNVAIRLVIENAIASLQRLGASYDSALKFLFVQSAIRMESYDDAQRQLDYLNEKGIDRR